MPRTSDRQISSHTNALGYDPDGRLTHLVRHVYGTWVPDVVPEPRFFGQYQSPPRYGPPSARQIPWLPAGFRPRSPPLFYGSPRAPYLPPPHHYTPAVFSGLVSRPRRHRFDGANLLEAHATVVPISAGGMCTKI